MCQNKTYVFIFIAMIYYFGYFHGVDVIPGQDDEIAPSKEHPNQDFLIFQNSTMDKAETGVVRLQTAADTPITESQETKLRPLLEALEQALEKKESKAFIVKKLKKLNILPDNQIDGLDAININTMLTQFSATASSSEHYTRTGLATFAVLETGYFSGIPVFLNAFVFYFTLPFLPKGHILTTAGRHDDGGRTWFGLRRAHLAIYLMIQYGLIFTANTWLFLKTYKMNTTERKQQGTAGRQFRSLFLNIRRFLDLLIAAVFTYVGYRLYQATPEGWLVGGFSTTNWTIDPSECGAEFHENLAGEMYFAFMAFATFQLLETLVVVLNSPIAEPDQVLGRLSGQPVWLWYLVLYFSPFDDAAFPILMECVRLISSAIFRFFKQEDYYVGPITKGMEFFQMAATFFFACHYPKVLYIRFPNLIQGAVTMIWNLRWLFKKIIAPCTWGTDWVSNTTTEHVTVYIPSDAPTAVRIPGKPGRWIIKKDVQVRLDKTKMKVEMEGAMREVLHLYDEAGAFFKDYLISNHMDDIDQHRLVYKRYNQSVSSALSSQGRDIESLTFGDAYMQFRSNCLAKDFNRAVPNQANRIAFNPVAVMKHNGKYHGVECYLYGHYKKWNNNGLWPDILLSVDDIPSCFSHFSYQHTQGREMVTDIQGIDASRGSLRHIFTDPQMHTVPYCKTFGIGNISSRGMQNFLSTHICGHTCHSMGLNNGNYSGVWSDGSEAQIKVQKMLKLKIAGRCFIIAFTFYLFELFLDTFLPNWNFVNTFARYVVYFCTFLGIYIKANKYQEQSGQTKCKSAIYIFGAGLLLYLVNLFFDWISWGGFTRYLVYTVVGISVFLIVGRKVKND